tara:strand:+ start:336 stop:884 length:549 start_codon:yes stop_codon:yes gene_type:complete
MLNQKTKDRVLEFIKGRPMGCSALEISKDLEMNRITLAKYLSTLYSEGIVGYKSVGMAKLWYFEKNPILRTMLHDADQSKTLKLLFNSMGVGVVVLNKGLEIVWFNEEMNSLIGKKEDVKGKKLSEFFKKDSDKLLSEKVLKTRKVHRGSIFAKGNNYLITSSPILDKDGKIVGVIEVFSMK